MAKYSGTKKHIVFLLILLGIMFLAAKSHSAGQTSNNFAIPVDVLSNGGRNMDSTTYDLASTQGQSSAIGISSSSSYKQSAGYWPPVFSTPGGEAINKASGVTYTWNGSVDSDWSKPDNWTPPLGVPLGTPADNDDVIISSGTVTYSSLPAYTSGLNTIQISGGTLNVSSGTLDTGTLTLSSGTVNYSTAASIGTFTFTGGTLTGAGTVTVSTSFTWSGGIMSGGTGVTTLASGCVTSINTGGTNNISARTLNNSGSVVFNDRVNTTSACVINNLSGGTFDVPIDDTFLSYVSGGVASFNNAGLLQKSVGTGTATINAIFDNTGTIDIQSGTLRFNRNSTNSGNIQGTGTLDVSTVSFTNPGTISPGTSPGILSITGNLPQESASVLNIEIGGLTPGTQHDRLDTSGSAVLAGTLNVSLIDSFVPSDGDSFTIMNYSSRSGIFNTVNLPADTTWGVDYGATDIILTAGTGEDTDSDGMEDNWEYEHFGDLSHDGTADTDHDDLSDIDEYLNNTDPNTSDSDSDGFLDGFEVWADTDPNNIGDYPATNIFFVDGTSGEDGNNGQNWDYPKATIQATLDACSAAGGGEVWISSGTYNESIALRATVDLYGGFVGTETSSEFDLRNWVTNTTTLDGQDTIARMVTGANNATIDGFVITGGNDTVGDGGAGMYNSGVSPTVKNCVITGNKTTSGYGVGVYNIDSNAKFINCIISNNTATAFIWGLGMINVRGAPTITNCTFSGNSGPAGNETAAITNIQATSPIITNSIIWGNTPAGYANDLGTGSPMVTYNNIQDGVIGEGGISSNPLFVVGDSYFHLQPGSPCINAGDNAAPDIPTMDIDKDPRIFPVLDGIVDMGADEFTTQYTLTMQVVGNGSTIPDEGDNKYYENAVVDVQAIPDSGWLFSDWSGDLSGSDNPATITMNSDKNVTATFMTDSDNDGGGNSGGGGGGCFIATAAYGSSVALMLLLVSGFVGIAGLRRKFKK